MVAGEIGHLGIELAGNELTPGGLLSIIEILQETRRVKAGKKHGRTSSKRAKGALGKIQGETVPSAPIQSSGMSGTLVRGSKSGNSLSSDFANWLRREAASRM